MSTTTQHWALGLAGELAEQQREREERIDHEAAEASREHSALMEGIKTWWRQFVIEIEAAADALRSIVVLTVDAETAGRVHVLRVGGRGRVEVVVEADGALRVTRETDVREVGHLRFVAGAADLEPSPADAARDILTPWLRQIGRRP